MHSYCPKCKEYAVLEGGWCQVCSEQIIGDKNGRINKRQ